MVTYVSTLAMPLMLREPSTCTEGAGEQRECWSGAQGAALQHGRGDDGSDGTYFVISHSEPCRHGVIADGQEFIGPVKNWVQDDSNAINGGIHARDAQVIGEGGNRRVPRGEPARAYGTCECGCAIVRF